MSLVKSTLVHGLKLYFIYLPTDNKSVIMHVYKNPYYLSSLNIYV